MLYIHALLASSRLFLYDLRLFDDSFSGNLKRLRRLILNSNHIRHMPDQIGHIDMLEVCMSVRLFNDLRLSSTWISSN